jgi:hypothetical protein
MGVTPSFYFNIPYGFKHFAVMFGYTDRLRLILAPPEVINETKIILDTLWKIQDIKQQPGFIEIKLKGTPFSPSSELDKSVKYLMCLILKKYSELGYHFKASIDLIKKGSSSDAVIFEKREPISTYTICISLNSTDKIRVFAPEEVIGLVRNTIIQTWSYGIQREKTISNGWQFKLNGNPWLRSANNDETYISAFMINTLIQTLYNHGWVFIGSIKSGQRQFDLNSLYFRFDSNLLQSLKSEPNPSRFFSLTLNKNDRIRLINAPNDLIALVRTAINEAWSRGVQEEFNVIAGYEFKLKGKPWWCNGDETVFSRRLVSNILRLMRQYNWSLYATCELSTQLDSKSGFFFRFDPTRLNSRPLCISLNESDKIRVIDGTQNHINAVLNAIQSSWPEGIQKVSSYSLSHQFKLRGYPFSGDFSNSLYTAVAVMFIISNLQTQGATFLCSASVSGKYVTEDHNSYPMDLSSLFFFF